MMLCNVQVDVVLDVRSSRVRWLDREVTIGLSLRFQQLLTLGRDWHPWRCVLLIFCGFFIFWLDSLSVIASLSSFLSLLSIPSRSVVVRIVILLRRAWSFSLRVRLCSGLAAFFSRSFLRGRVRAWHLWLLASNARSIVSLEVICSSNLLLPIVSSSIEQLWRDRFNSTCSISIPSMIRSALFDFVLRSALLLRPCLPLSSWAKERKDLLITAKQRKRQKSW